MRYCSHCGNPLSPGASFCHTCGVPLKAVVPAADETPVEAPIAEVEDTPAIQAEETVEVPAAEPAAAEPVVLNTSYDQDILEEKKFLEETHKFLRWERKAWSISGKVLLIFGIVFGALFLLMGIVFAAQGIENEGLPMGIMFFLYALIYGVMFIGIGIVNLTAAGKIPQYTDTMYKDFRAAHQRCGSVGMIVFGYFFNTIALIFYVINFVRMKSNKAMIARILARQGF